MHAKALRELWGPIGQIGYVVTDLEAAAKQWTDSIGVGPWQIFNPAPFDVLEYNGQPSEAEVGFALAFMGAVQIELIQQHNNAPSMYREVLDTYGEGAQHICFYPDDYAAAVDAGCNAGMTIAQQGEIWGIDFVYLRGEGGRVIELARLGDERRAMRQRAIEDATVWDGSDPFRHH
jgi:catechol 2,3-dioxygenase-like lactoylglutathione lyase family enzyme